MLPTVRWGWRAIAPVVAMTAAMLPAIALRPAPAEAASAGTWNGSRAELFLIDVVTPAIAPGGGSRPVTATLVNHGPSNATSIRFRYTVPTGLTYSGASVGGGSCTFNAPTVSCTVASLANGARVPVSVELAAPGGTPVGAKAGAFSAVTADQFTPAGGNLLLRLRDPHWIGNDEDNLISPLWPPSDPYTGAPPRCRDFTDYFGVFHPCSATVTTTTVLSDTANHWCELTSEIRNCIRTWELVGTYYATATGTVNLCMTKADDGAYVNWSSAYDPAVGAGPSGPYHNVAETPSWSPTWNTGGWSVTAGRAYRFSIRIANRDRVTGGFTYGAGGFASVGLSTVNGGAATCRFQNFAPPQPANVTVSANAASVRLSTELGTARAEQPDQFTVQIRDGGGVVNSTVASTTAGSGSTVTPGSGTTGSTDVTPGGGYSLTEVGAGATDLSRYDTSISCTNSNAGSPTVLPGGTVDLNAPPTLTPAAGDAIDCVLTNTVRPRLTIVATTAILDGTFGYTVSGGPTPANPSITTAGRTGSLVLDGTQVGQQVDVVADPVTGWRISSSVCTNANNGTTVALPYTLQTGDDIVCTFVNRPIAAVYQPCPASNLVRNGTFGTGLTSWSAGGGWTAAGGRAVNTDPAATFATGQLRQTVYGVTPGAGLAVDVIPADGAGGNGGNQAALQIVYDGTVYATITSTAAAAGFGGNAIVAGANGATVSPATIPMAGGGTVTLTLPGGVPRTGELRFQMAVTGAGDTNNAADSFGVDNVQLHAAAICLQVESVGGHGTFAFTTTNIDTAPATPATEPGFTVTTTAGSNPATVNPDFTAAPQLSVLTPGTDVTFAQSGPVGWQPDTITCQNAATGADVPAGIAAGTVTVDGATIAGQTIVNCYLTEQLLLPTVTLVTTTISRDATFGYTVTGGPTPATPSITTSHQVGTRTLGNTQIGQVLGITANPVSGWRVSTRVCVEARTGALVALPYTLQAGDDLVCTFTNRPVAPAGQPCPITNLIRNDTFGSGLTAWDHSGSWVVAGGRATNPDPAATFATDRLAQTVSGVAPRGAIAVDVVPRDIGAGDQARLEISYGGTRYATVATSPADAVGGNATVTEANGATVSDLALPMNQSRTLVVYLPPAGVPKSGALEFRFEGANTGASTADTVLLDEVRVLTTAICLQVRSHGGVSTFRYTTGNVDTDPTVAADVPVFTVTTTAGRNPATVNPDFTAGGTQLLVPTPDLDVSFTQTGPVGWKFTQLTCRDAFTQAPVPVTFTGSTATIAGAGVAAYTIVNCLITDRTHRYAVTKTANRSAALPGQLVTFTVTITNTGATAYPDASFRDDLSGVLDDATLVSLHATRGSTVVRTPYLTWNGDLPVGAEAVVTYTMRVQDVPAGDRRLDNTVTVDAPGAHCVTQGARCRAVTAVAPGRPGTGVPVTGPAAAPAGYLAVAMIVLGVFLRRATRRRPGR
ncbi:putative repeat protein (TIGR01451 family) [Krasilnikovia cinnamomea]|uniref:Putative repeat protein (TIGR01451 family) n=1 Tax=Krasilnikovia cinnamomea TaxID=349313 RepID=A0A4Q7ZQU2_9ACTN|nr:DUF11 domain-containing protein [Krasilnikovia cinnamomea]RZU53154.1 putative repeat protein (TIGR01451 family) [Krasilnikovia cinnamomea]